MSEMRPTGSDKIRAIILAHELKAKMEEYWLEPPQEERIAETRQLQQELEEMGFLVQWSVSLNPEACTLSATIQLFTHKPLTDAEWEAWERSVPALSPHVIARLKQIRLAALSRKKQS